VIADVATDEPLGVIALRHFDPPMGTAQIGTWVARPLWGTGVNVEAKQLLLDYAFGPLGLHRIEARIVPDEKNVDGFITMMDAEAQKSGVYLRRYAAKDVKSQQYYSEVPFDMELDGRYYDTLQFFDRVSKLERIVNINGLLVSTAKNPSGAKTKRTYQYAPNESVVATFTATTYFSHDLQPSAAGAGAKPATPAVKK
jgi:hypothetical protein